MSHYEKQTEQALRDSVNLEDLMVRVRPLVGDVEFSTDKPYDEEFMEPEFLHFIEVLKLGAKKYSRDNWLESNGKRSSHKEMHDSIFHHIAESYAHIRTDKESGLDPLLHAAARCLMLYCRIKRNIIHEKDKNND